MLTGQNHLYLIWPPREVRVSAEGHRSQVLEWLLTSHLLMPPHHLGSVFLAVKWKSNFKKVQMSRCVYRPYMALDLLYRNRSASLVNTFLGCG